MNTTNVDYNFIAAREGGVVQDGYVPTDKNGNVIGHSGVTIGAGVDLGQQSVAGLRALGVSEDIIAAVSPYLGMTMADAQDYLQQHPLTLSSDQATSLTNAINQATVSKVASNFDAASTVGEFSSLPAGTQTAIADVAFQYGTNLAKATPNFWTQVTNGDWQGALANLNNFGDSYQSRRSLEASLIKSDLDQGLLPPGK